MVRRLAFLLLFVCLPLSASAATFETARTVVLSEPQTDNVYLAGTDVTVVTPLPGDLMAVGTAVTASSPIAGDAMIAGGSIDIQKPVLGDVRAIGGHVSVEGPITGDLVAAGLSVVASSSAKFTQIAGATVDLTGAAGPVTIYGSDIALAGDFKGDVTVVASDKITIADGTHIHGALRYNAPQEIVAPPSAVIDGGEDYIGSARFLPTSKEARTFAVAGATILFIVHLIAVLILAGLMAGFFPQFTEQVAERSLPTTAGNFLLLALLGFGIFVATPVLILVLLISFAGIGVAILLIPVYALLLILSYIYAGIVAGAALARALMKRRVVTWKEAVLGMLVFYIIGVIPVLGMLVKFILIMATAGAITSLAYAFAFKREQQEELPLT